MISSDPNKPLKILIAAAEVAPFAKVGGLADVAGALPKALKALGHDVRVIMPSYRMIETDPRNKVKALIPWFDVPINSDLTERARIGQTLIGKDIPVYLVGSDHYFTEATESKKVYTLEPEPYIFFDRTICEAIPRLSPEWTPDIIHCNDWHTGLTPVYLDLFYGDNPTWANTARVFTIHNLAYQGDFDRDLLRRAGLPESVFTFDRLEFYGRLNLMKGGLVYSDLVNTVSETYAREIQTSEYGCRLDGLLQHLQAQGRLSGIVNGIDYDEYNPKTDPRIPAHFGAASPGGKAACKKALQKEAGLPQDSKQVLIGVISRLADQKGFDLISEIAERMLNLPVQLIVLGSGEPKYEAVFKKLERDYPEKAKAFIGFDAALAQRIYAGCDMFLMPSRFEPCGLGQLMSLRYGTIPLVRATGGLADTIQDYAPGGKGNGFVFSDYSSEALFQTVERAVAVYQRKAAWAALVKRAMSQDFSWTHSARGYEALYRRAVCAHNSDCYLAAA
jgi:starch synthase